MSDDRDGRLIARQSVCADGDRLVLAGELTRTRVPAISRELRRVPLASLRVVDLSRVTRLDSAGIGMLEGLRDGLFGKPLELRDPTPHVAEMLELFAGEPVEPAPEERTRVTVRDILETIRYVAGILMDAFILSGEIFYWSVRNVVFPSGHRKGEVTEQIIVTGLNAVPIVATLSFIIGVILALQAAVQLERFGGGPFLADLMGLAMVREMGPLLTAIIITGRSGSAIASEIGTMRVTDELDALRAMGIRPVEYVIAPKMIAFTIVTPLLSILSAAVGLLGGVLVSTTFVGQPAQSFIDRALGILGVPDAAFLMLKGLLFGWAIMMTSCYCGYQVTGGAVEVGRATTQAVVSSIFAIVLLNVIFSLWYVL